MQETVSLQAALENHELRVALGEDDIVLDVVVLIEVMPNRGDKSLKIITDEHSNWLKTLGMITMAKQMMIEA